MPTHSQDPWIGKRLGEGGRYLLESLLGSGSMGRVYRAIDQKLSVNSLPSYKAIKFMSVNLAARADARERFQREMQACMSLQDSRIVQVFDYGMVPSRWDTSQPVEVPFMVMEWISAPTLDQVMLQHPRFDQSRVIHLGRQIAATLQTIHSGTSVQGKTIRFVHRDLKPGNIFLVTDAVDNEAIKIGDFGMVKFLGDLNIQALTKTGRFGGTPGYVAPEQCRGLKTIDGRADLYGLGCVLYELLTGSNLFGFTPQAGVMQWIEAHLHQPPLPMPPELGISRSLEQIVRQCLEKDPNNRFSTARELEQALRKEQEGIPLTAAPPRSLERRAVPLSPAPRSAHSVTATSLVEAEIIEFLEEALARYFLKIQLQQDNDLLTILLIRLRDRPLDYGRLTATIVEQIKVLELPDIRILSLLSQPEQATKPDWSRQIDLTTGTELPSLVETIVETPAQHTQPLLLVKAAAVQPDPLGEILGSDLDLSAYCFVRNTYLVQTALPLPPADIAQAVQFFDQLSTSDKRQLLPVLVDFFKEPEKANRANLSLALQAWLLQIEKLDPQKVRSIAVWLSRYCADPYKTLEEVSPSLRNATEVAVANQPEESTRSGRRSLPPQPIQEPILYQARPHWIAHVMRILLGVILAGLVITIVPSPLSLGILRGLGLPSDPFWLILLIQLGLVVPAFLVFRLWIDHRKSTLLLSSSQLAIKQSSLYRPLNTELPLDAITEVMVDSDSLGNALQFGTITLIVKGDAPRILAAITQPQEFKSQFDFLKQQRLMSQRLKNMPEPPSRTDPNAQEGSDWNGSADQWLGKIVGDGKRYRLETLLGVGGMGKVYKAMDQKLSVHVAIKFMLATKNTTAQDRERFQREMQACINLQDSRIVKVLDFGIINESGNTTLPFLVMEFVQAPTLEQVLVESPQLPLPRAVNLARQIVAALQAVHRGVTIQGRRIQMVHRDLKPSNIFVLRDGVGGETIKLADFGLVKFQGGLTMNTLSQTGEFRGTPTYSSPEQCEGLKKIDGRADIYSMGCIFYEMLTGTNPFGLPSSATPMQWMYAQVHTRPRPFLPSQTIPKPLEAIVMRCLEKDPSLRFNTLIELNAALNQLPT